MVPAHSHKVSRVSWYSGSCCPHSVFAYGAFTLSGRSFQDRSANLARDVCSPNPRVHALWFGLFPFRSPLLRKSLLFSLPPATSMFQFTGFPLYTYWACAYSVHSGGGFLRRVSPFRNLRIMGYVLLPAAYRSLSRLSSALGAKASSLRSF